MVFFPSYRFMEDVYTCIQSLEELDDAIEIVLQSQFMGEEAREIFLETFEEERTNTLIGFCVMGGVFSEGIDLTAERLIGAIIVGTGLPQVCNERELLKQWFDKRQMSGFDYAYLYPGMNKVQQAAGRVIRTDEDRGVILLLDERFAGSTYKKLFPREWEQHDYCHIDSLEAHLNAFWSKNTP